MPLTKDVTTLHNFHVKSGEDALAVLQSDIEDADTKAKAWLFLA